MNETNLRTLVMMLRGAPQGYTRKEIAARLGVGDRMARQLIEDVVASGELPIICDRGESRNEEGRYRIARQDEIGLVNLELAELRARALSAFRRAKGLRMAFAESYQASALWLDEVEGIE
ncbi:MAG TPA: hypothetical protein VIG24_01640 [Acidimicrobiia bacterium]